jgi:hypothetical protein
MLSFSALRTYVEAPIQVWFQSFFSLVRVDAVGVSTFLDTNQL